MCAGTGFAAALHQIWLILSSYNSILATRLLITYYGDIAVKQIEWVFIKAFKNIFYCSSLYTSFLFLESFLKKV